MNGGGVNSEVDIYMIQAGDKLSVRWNCTIWLSTSLTVAKDSHEKSPWTLNMHLRKDLGQLLGTTGLLTT